ncbi:MAG: hypothetical protein RMM17_03610 [Acidobacteriota bacterium]|nr:hypothetical protein [Blastocatellia bacterium]MDW8411755.1 hypothetical protein [Acidobacteriota bacterium]
MLRILSLLIILASAKAQLRISEQPPDIDKIIKSFAEKEAEFQQARNLYTFRQEVRIQTLADGNRVTGEYYRVSDILFDDAGRRYEKIIKFPPSTLQGLIITPTDLRDIAETQPFSLTTKELPKYIITYVGKEKIDELDTYVFDVRPKSIPKYKRGGERVFSGRIWVDDQDLQIVKTFGKGLPEGEERFPTFETYRENIDGKYWFPTYTFADDVLDFGRGNLVHMRMEIRYTKYKKFTSDVKIDIESEE